MSLPERSEAGRNYDYRYVWIRDQCYTGQAVAADGPHRLLDEAVAFVADRILADGPDLKPAYTAGRGPVPDERALSHLAGYPGGSDKVGNWVNRQFQLDALGESLQLFAAAARHGHLGTEQLASRRDGRGRDREALAGPGRRRRGTRRPALVAPWLMCVAGLRAIAAAGAAPAQAVRLGGAGRQRAGRRGRGQPASQRPLAARPGR